MDSMLKSKNSKISEEKQKLIRAAFCKMEGDPQSNSTRYSKTFKELYGVVKPVGSFVNGSYMTSEVSYKLSNSYSEEVTEVLLCTKDIAEKAIENASSASQEWSQLRSSERSCLMLNIADNIERKKELFTAAAVSAEKSSSLSASDDISFLIQCFQHFSNVAFLNEETENLKPFGVVLIISEEVPFKIYWHICAALAFGNAVIFHVSPSNCLLPLLLAQFMIKSGIPAGVFNVLPATEIPSLQQLSCGVKVFFEGLPEKYLKAVEPFIKRGLVCELLASSHTVAIIFEESDIDSAIQSLLRSFRYLDSRSIDKVLIQDSISDHFVKTMQHYFQDSEVNGSLNYVDISVDQTKFDVPKSSSTVLTGIELVTGNFKRNVPLTTFRSAKEAVDMCNSGKYESVSVWCEKSSLALEMAKKIRPGVVWINNINIFHPAAFGGTFERSVKGSSELSRFHFMRREIKKLYLPCITHSYCDLPDPSLCESKFYYGGKFNASQGNKMIKIEEHDPVTYIPDGCIKDVVSAILCAAAAKSKWKTVSASDRARMLLEIAEKLKDKREDFVRALKRTKNRDHEDCLNEVNLAILKIRYWTAYCQRLDGSIVQTKSNGMSLHVLESSGVIGIVCPDECPFLSFISLVVSAVALGNVVVAFPSISNPLPAFLACEIFHFCNLMAGVINVVYITDFSLIENFLHKEVNSFWIPISTWFYVSFPNVLSKALKHSYLYTSSDCDWLSTDNTIVHQELTFHAVTSKVIFLPDGDMFP